MNEIDVKDLCRICASGSGKDAVFLLIDGDVKTELGEIFESCIGLQVIVCFSCVLIESIQCLACECFAHCSYESQAFRIVCATTVNSS